MSFFLNRIILTVLAFSSISCVETVNSSLLKAVSLVAGEQEVIISAPNGFCVDQKQVSREKGVIMLFIIDCVMNDNNGDINAMRRPLSAILTATVIDFQESELKSISRLEEVLTRKPGINFLSRTNTNAVLKVHHIENIEGLLFFLIEQRPSDIDVKQSNYFWRVFFIIDEKIISMTASNFSHGVASQKRLKRLINEFANSTLAANKR